MTDRPHYYIAQDFLAPPADPEAGVKPVAAYAPGDLVHPADVDAYGWHGKVTRPGAAPQPEHAAAEGRAHHPSVPEQEPPRTAPAATPDTEE